MKKIFTKQNLIALAITSLWAVPLLVSAQASLGIEYGTATGLGTRDLKDTIVQILNVILGFLGIIAVIIILLGGFKWMTAAGNEDKVAEAKKVLTAGIIGLAIVLAAYAIATYVVNVVGGATTE